MLVKKRVILYIISFIVIVSISVSTIFVLKGYYVDLSDFSIKKSGSIFLKTIPRNSNIYIDNKLKKKKSPINIPLPAGTYEVKVDKDGYIPWQKSINVESGFVAWEAYIFLIKKDRNEKVISEENVYDYLMSPSFNNVAYSDDKGNVYDVKTDGKDKKTIYENTTENSLTNIIDWSQDKTSVLIKTTNKNKESTYAILRNGEQEKLPHIPGTIKKIEFKNNSNKDILVLSENKIYSISADNASTEDDNISDFSQTRKNIFYAKNYEQKSHLIKCAFNFSGKEVITEKDEQISLISASEKGTTAFITQDETLWLSKKNETKKIADDVLFIKWSHEEKNLLFGKYGEIRVYVERQEDPREPKNKMVTRLSTPIDEIKWFYDDGHLLIRIKNTITFLPIDGMNQVVLTDKSPESNNYATTKYGREFIYTKITNSKNQLIISQIGEENGLIPY